MSGVNPVEIVLRWARVASRSVPLNSLPEMSSLCFIPCSMLRKFDYQMSHLHDGERREFMRQPSAQINLELAEEYMKLELQERAHDMKRVTMDFLGVST